MTLSTPAIPTYVIAGFLGAGKTSLINSILSTSSEPLAVIVNDFGAVNIDASLIASHTDDVVELTNGCVCCSVGESLADALFVLLDRPNRPSAIVIEASGVADPAQVSAYTYLDGLVNGGTIVLVDAVNCLSTAKDSRLRQTFLRQLHAGDLVALTKKDLITPEHLQAVHAFLSDQCATTPIVDASTQVLSQVILSDFVRDGSETISHSFCTEYLHQLIYTDETHVRQTLSQWSETAIRAKGIIELVDGTRCLIQQVGRHIALTPTDLEPTGIVIICTQ